MTDEQITGLLEKINNIIKKEPEFKERLKKELFGDVVLNEASVKDNSQDKELSKKIGAITQYLALDNQLDRAESTIDYSWVNDEFTREQLFADFREMLRYRWNCRSHKADFFEFCKFAHFQIEGLINYYYRVKCNNDINSVKCHILKYLPNARLDYSKTLESISCSTKMVAYSIESRSLEKLPYSLNLRTEIIRNIRNEQNHRNVNEDSDDLEITSYRKELEDKGLSFNSYGELKYSNNQTFKEELNSDDFKEYHKLIYMKNEFYDLVFDTLKQFTENIKSNIAK